MYLMLKYAGQLLNPYQITKQLLKKKQIYNSLIKLENS